MAEIETSVEVAKASRHFYRATDQAATAVAELMLQFDVVPPGEKLPKEQKEARTLILDNAAAEILKTTFNELDIGVTVVGCEGDKERQEAKGGVEVDVLEGFHGSQIGLQYDVVLDPVEGTTAACSRREGAVAIIAFSEAGGLQPTPRQSEIILGGKDEEVHYMYKLIASAEANGVLDIARGAQYNVDAMTRLYGKDTLNLVVMNRPANQDIIDAARAEGIQLTLIEAGDLLPSLAAATGHLVDGKHVVVYGRGGDQEGRIAAAAAKAFDGFAQGQVWIPSDIKDVPLADLPIFDRDQLVPGKAQKTGVVFTPITDEKTWFGLSGYDNGTDTLQKPTSLAILHKDAADVLAIEHARDHVENVRVLSN